MEKVLTVGVIFLVIIIVSLIFYLRNNEEEIDYDKYIKLMKEQTKNNLDILNTGNKVISKLNNKIYNYKKKLGYPFLKK